MAVSEMDHEVAEKTSAVDRYLLNEMEPQERDAFEAHYFDCPICGDKVRQGAAFIDNAKDVLQTWTPAEPKRAWFRAFNLSWLRPTVFVPSLASLCLLAVISYQNLVTLPALRAPQFLTTAVIAPLARAESPQITIDPEKPLFNLNFSVDSPQVYPDYRCEFQNAQGTTVLTLHSGGHDVSSFTLSFLLPASKFPDGSYSLTLRPENNGTADGQRYTFAIRRGRSDGSKIGE